MHGDGARMPDDSTQPAWYGPGCNSAPLLIDLTPIRNRYSSDKHDHVSPQQTLIIQHLAADILLIFKGSLQRLTHGSRCNGLLATVRVP